MLSGKSCNNSVGGSWCSGVDSNSLYPSEHKNCIPFFRKWVSSQYVESIVAKGNFCTTTYTILKVKSIYLGAIST